MNTFGAITLNLSLFLYFIHFIPQILHNIINPHYRNISLYSLIFYFIATGLDMIYGIGFSYPWQYIAVDLFYLAFLLVQQFQLLRHGQFKAFSHLLILGWVVVVISAVLYLLLTPKQTSGFHIGSKDDLSFWVAGYLCTFLWIVLWLPQIFKNFYQKQADGYSRIFWVIGIIMVLCDLSSTLVFGWKWLNVLQSSFSLLIHLTLLSQSYYYKTPAQKTPRFTPAYT